MERLHAHALRFSMAARANVAYDRLIAVVLCVLATCSSPTTQAYDPFITPSIVSSSPIDCIKKRLPAGKRLKEGGAADNAARVPRWR